MVYSVEGYIGNTPQQITVEAGSREEAAARVVQKIGEGRMTILRVRPASQRTNINFLAFWKKVGIRDLEFFCRQMHALLSSGVTALGAINAIAQQTEKPALKKALLSISGNIREGFPLSLSFQGYPDIFPAVFCSAVAAAEEAGVLSEIMSRLAEHFSHEARFWERMRQAAAYPSIVATLALVEVVALFTYIVPKFSELLKSSNIMLPASTQFLFNMSSGIVFPMVLGLFAVLLYSVRHLWKNKKTRRYLELFLTRIPVLGRLFSRSAVARVCRTLALMLKVGIPATQALNIAARVAGFSSLKRELEYIQEAIREGKSMAEAFSKSRWLPATGIEMLSVGESAGRLDEMLEHAASLLETEVEALTQKLPPLTEATLVIMLGGIILFVLIAIYSPMFDVYQTIK
ncbi:MAG: type II secretion system F family protein [Peptococcaceae bacterium]|nr:type II secretion system F family protein [Peptococcaceae bacterium]